MSGNVGEMLSVLIVCEWSYLSWAKIVDGEAKRENFVLFEWIDLHTSLEDVVAYLRNLDECSGSFLLLGLWAFLYMNKKGNPFLFLGEQGLRKAPGQRGRATGRGGPGAVPKAVSSSRPAGRGLLRECLCS